MRYFTERVALMEFFGKKSVWETLCETDEPVIMYGTGNGADKVFEHLARLGVKVSGVAASDGFVRSRAFHGFNVRPVSDFEKEYEDFTVIVTFGSSRPEVIADIKNIAERRRVLVPCVPVIENDIFDRERVCRDIEKITAARELLYDDESRRVYDGVLGFMFTGRLESLFAVESSRDEAYENIIKLGKNECFADIGAYRGDTVERFLKMTGGKYAHIVAAEPDTKSFNKLMLACGGLENFTAVNAAVTGVDGEVGFYDHAGRQSAVGGEKVVKSVTLPALCGGLAPTYIKIDAEGCESAILQGGAELIAKYLPSMEIAAYHRTADIYELPLLLHEIAPQLKMHLRHHPYIPAWDTLIYCTK